MLSKKLCICGYSVVTPSMLGKRRKRVVTKPTKITTWDREIICLPNCYKELSVNGIMPIPRKKKDVLASFGLVGRLHLESDWTDEEVKEEIRSTFNNATGDKSFSFRFLQITGTGKKSLMIPMVSNSYKWTPKEVAGRADKPVYIIMENVLKDEVGMMFR